MASSQASAGFRPGHTVWSTTARLSLRTVAHIGIFLRILAVVQQQDPYRLCGGLLCGSGIGGRNAGILPNGQGRHGIQPQIVGQIGHGESWKVMRSWNSARPLSPPTPLPPSGCCRGRLPALASYAAA